MTFIMWTLSFEQKVTHSCFHRSTRHSLEHLKSCWTTWSSQAQVWRSSEAQVLLTLGTWNIILIISENFKWYSIWTDLLRVFECKKKWALKKKELERITPIVHNLRSVLSAYYVNPAITSRLHISYNPRVRYK